MQIAYGEGSNLLLRSLLAERVEQAWKTGEVAGPGGAAARASLGHDTAGLHRYLNAGTVVATTPHASANVFFPRADSHVHAARMARADPGVFQVRAVLTHATLSDLRWRPYAWWLAPSGSLEKFVFQSRNKSRKHVTVHACAPIDARQDVDRVPVAYREAWQWAGAASNLAWSSMILAAAQERLGGVAEPGRTLFVPLQWLVEVAAAWLGAGDPGLRAGLRDRERTLDGATGRLVEGGTGGQPFLYDNATNLLLLGLFTDIVVGGAKMAGYWPDLATDAATGVAEHVTAPRFQLKPPTSWAQTNPPAEILAGQLSAAGIPYSLGMAQTALGAPLL